VVLPKYRADRVFGPENVPGGRFQEPREQFQNCRLSRGVRAAKCDSGIRKYPQVDFLNFEATKFVLLVGKPNLF
jgi:hypothetical protein